MTDKPRRKRLGDFEIVRELGRGGMGIVYEARQRSLNRRVALKVLSSGLGMTSKAVLRFRREAETAAKLHHTNIVPIHATGEEDGTHYYAMELVDGPSLNFVIRHMRDQRSTAEPKAHPPSAPPSGSDSTVAITPNHALPKPLLEDTATRLPDWVAKTMAMEPGGDAPASRFTCASGTSMGGSSSTITAGHSYFDTIARMIADVADALGYAHGQNVVHRDMKPSNLLLSSDGRVSINDFGLARMLEQPGMTTTGEFMGSPLYMSPEQITAGRAPLDHRTDIYSLGATLYELLTLQPPFLGERRDQIIGQIMHKEPRPLRSVNKKIPVDLETICLKAMEKDPDQRYQTGEQFAEDLRRFVNRFAISARRASVLGRTTKWVRRHPAVAVLMAMVVLTGGVAGLFAYNSHLADIRIVQLELAAAKENALLHAMSGAFDAAEKDIQAAETAGASAGWVRLLRGQVAYYQGRLSDAMTHLEQAVHLMPDSAAAVGLMCITLSELGAPDALYAIHEKLTQMKAEEFQDLLLRGLGETWLSPRLAIEDLDEAISLRPMSPVARMVRADALRYMAMHRGELRFGDLSVADASLALGLLPNNPMALRHYVLAQIVRANLLMEAGRSTDHDTALQEAKSAANELARFTDDNYAVWTRAFYDWALGNDDEAHARLCEGSKGLAKSRVWMAAGCANGWFNRHNPTKAIEAFERQGGRDVSIFWWVPVFLRMEQSQDLQALLDEYIPTTSRRDNASGFFEVLDWATFRLLGDTERTADVAARWLKYRVPGDFGDQWHALAKYMAGDANASETIEACEGARFPQSYALYIIAIDSLANGDREAAKEYFRASVDLNFFNLFSSIWSKSFLERLEHDPAWPPWIPMRDSEALPKNTDRPSAGILRDK